MAAIVPTSTIYLCANVPLDPAYGDVINFASLAAQTAYFQGKVFQRYEKYTFQRVQSSVPGGRPAYSIRVDAISESIRQCNYIMFQNTSMGTKWYYAFVSEINYISPKNTELVYQIDWYQSFQFDFTILPSFVEREHSATNALFENFEPEPVSIDGYKYILGPETFNANPHIIVCTSTDVTGKIANGQMINNIYSACQYHDFTDAGSANALISQYANEGRLEAVVSVFMSPFGMNDTAERQWSIPGNPYIEGYTPRNNKLLSYPYCSVIMADMNNTRQELRYEYFKGAGVGAATTMNFRIISCFGPSPSLAIVPDYCSVRNFSYGIETQDMPVCAWAGDVFANWIGKNKWTTVAPLAQMGLFSTSFGGGGNAQEMMNNVSFTPNTTGTGIFNSSGINGFNSPLMGLKAMLPMGMGSKVQEANAMYRASPEVSMPMSSQLNFSLQRIGFSLYYKCISAQNAACIDDYFDAFGYATNRLKVPNVWGRARFNYVKTRGLMISGDLPTEAANVIHGMFNSGVRFWHGDFTRDLTQPNPPVNPVVNKFAEVDEVAQ